MKLQEDTVLTDGKTFFDIVDTNQTITISWEKDIYKDYSELAESYFLCGYLIWNSIHEEQWNNFKADTCLFPTIFMFRQSLELQLKALLSKGKKNAEITAAFKNVKHDLHGMFDECLKYSGTNYLNEDEIEWLKDFLKSLQEIDKKSDMFRFPFYENILENNMGRLLDTNTVVSALSTAYLMLLKMSDETDEYDSEIKIKDLKPQLFTYTKSPEGNCYFWQPEGDKGYMLKKLGYRESIEILYDDETVDKEKKMLPILFMFRNEIELCLKQLLYQCSTCYGLEDSVYQAKKKSHHIKKDLWENIGPVLKEQRFKDSDLDITKKRIDELSGIDKEGDTFRYPTTYGLEYKLSNKIVDYEHVGNYLKELADILFDWSEYIEEEHYMTL